MTKNVKITNADPSEHQLVVETWDVHPTTGEVTKGAEVDLSRPFDDLLTYVWQERFLVIREPGVPTLFPPRRVFGFATAFELLKAGRRVRRGEWVTSFVFLVPGSSFLVSRPPLLGILEEGARVDYSPHVDIRGEDGTVSPWVPNQADLFAEDWEVVA
jgi:hypothetical protein